MAGPALLEALSNGWQGMMFLILRKLDSWSHLTSSMFEGMSHVDLISKDHFFGGEQAWGSQESHMSRAGLDESTLM